MYMFIPKKNMIPKIMCYGNLFFEFLNLFISVRRWSSIKT